MGGKFYFLLQSRSVKVKNEAFFFSLASAHCDAFRFPFILLIFDLCSVEVFLSQLTTNGAHVKVRAANAPSASVAPHTRVYSWPFLRLHMQNVVFY